MMTKAEEFANLSDVLIYNFDPDATEDQVDDVHITTFSDGSKFCFDPVKGKGWTCTSSS